MHRRTCLGALAGAWCAGLSLLWDQGPQPEWCRGPQTFVLREGDEWPQDLRSGDSVTIVGGLHVQGQAQVDVALDSLTVCPGSSVGLPLPWGAQVTTGAEKWLGKHEDLCLQ